MLCVGFELLHSLHSCLPSYLSLLGCRRLVVRTSYAGSMVSDASYILFLRGFGSGIFHGWNPRFFLKNDTEYRLYLNLLSPNNKQGVNNMCKNETGIERSLDNDRSPNYLGVLFAALLRSRRQHIFHYLVYHSLSSLNKTPHSTSLPKWRCYSSIENLKRRQHRYFPPPQMSRLFFHNRSYQPLKVPSTFHVVSLLWKYYPLQNPRRAMSSDSRSTLLKYDPEESLPFVSLCIKRCWWVVLVA